MGNTPKKRTTRKPKADELALGVQVSSGTPGVSPVAFLAIVEVIDQEGEKKYQVVTSDGLTVTRRQALLDYFAEINS